MANWDVCYNWMLDNEDAGRKYATVPDCGGQAISGINSAIFPLQFARIAALPPAERGAEVENFYKAAFWNQWLEQIESDDVAKRVFDASVNMGGVPAVRCLQEACGGGLATDGHFGPATVTAVNAAPSGQFVEAFKQARANVYHRIVAQYPDKGVYLNGWLSRALK